MTHIFYLLGISFLLYELICMKNPLKINLLVLNSIEDIKKPEQDRDDDLKLKGAILVIINSLYFIWIIIGALASSQSLLFIMVFIIMGVVSMLKKISSDVMYRAMIKTIDSFVSFVILCYLIANHFQHFDIIPSLTQLINN